jgi:hypothetical protein
MGWSQKEWASSNPSISYALINVLQWAALWWPLVTRASQRLPATAWTVLLGEKVTVWFLKFPFRRIPYFLLGSWPPFPVPVGKVANIGYCSRGQIHSHRLMDIGDYRIGLSTISPSLGLRIWLPDCGGLMFFYFSIWSTSWKIHIFVSALSS